MLRLRKKRTMLLLGTERMSSRCVINSELLMVHVDDSVKSCDPPVNEARRKAGACHRQAASTWTRERRRRDAQGHVREACPPGVTHQNPTPARVRKRTALSDITNLDTAQ